MVQGYFITGTDTNAGKTWVTVTLMHYFMNKGKSVVGFKPVASGCVSQGGRLVNADALLLQEHASVKLGYDFINPYAYELAASPHIAGKDNPVHLDVIAARFSVLKNNAQMVLVEGVGGWYSPINGYQQNSHLAKALSLPVILVVAVRLGCINHALLTFRAIIAESLVCAGWVAVCNEPNVISHEEIISVLKSMLDAPLIGVLPYQVNPNFDSLAKCLALGWEF